MSFAFEAFSTDLFSKAILLHLSSFAFAEKIREPLNVFISLDFLIFLFLHHFNKHHIVRNAPALWLWIADYGLGDQPFG